MPEILSGLFTASNTLFGPVGVLFIAILAGVGLYYFLAVLPNNTKFDDDNSQAMIREREDYVVWRQKLSQGGTIEKLYSAMLARGLDAADRFFGDPIDSKIGRVPFWGGHALDRCYFIAAIYPAATLFLIWHLTGSTGALETVFGLPPETERWQRILSGISLVLFAVAINRLVNSIVHFRSVVKVILRLFVTIASVALVFSFSFASPVLVMALIGVLFFAFGNLFLSGYFALMCGLSLASLWPTYNIVGGEDSTLLLILSAVITMMMSFIIVVGLNILYNTLERRLSLLFGILFGLLISIIAVALIYISSNVNDIVSNENYFILYYFLCAIPLINALFDWVSIGMTRFFLRIGQKLGGLWPIGLSLADLVTATLFLAALTMSLVAIISALNWASGSAVIDIGELLSRYRSNPGDPRLIWVYVLVVTTYLPSIANLVLGGLAIVRGVPGIHSFLIHNVLPEDPIGLTLRRRVAASAILTAQFGLALVGAIAVAILFIGIVFYGLNLIGDGLYEMISNLHLRLSHL